jgi:hypothetical protein
LSYKAGEKGVKIGNPETGLLTLILIHLYRSALSAYYCKDRHPWRKRSLGLETGRLEAY